MKNDIPQPIQCIVATLFFFIIGIIIFIFSTYPTLSFRWWYIPCSLIVSIIIVIDGWIDVIHKLCNINKSTTHTKPSGSNHKECEDKVKP